MALLAEILTATIGGGAPGFTLERGLSGFSFAVIAIDPTAFLAADEVGPALAGLADAIHRDPGARLPGERAAATAALGRRDGIDLPPEVWRRLEEAAAAFDLVADLHDLRRGSS
jgi:LDH2 family malate/lactate/ureidoglycolate dehydrogenase